MKRLNECITRMNHPDWLVWYDLKEEATLDRKKVAKEKGLLKIFADPYEALAYKKTNIHDESDPVGNIKNWLRYRICTRLKLYTDENFDCDATELTKDLMRELLVLHDIEIEKEEVRKFYLSDGIVLETDTMYSFATPFNNFMRHILIDEGIDPNFVQNYQSLFELENPERAYRDLYFLKHLDEWYKKSSTNYATKQAFEYLDEFALRTHTLGNMTLVPKHFNVNRRSECWDETLEELQSIATKNRDRNFAWFFENYHIFLYSMNFERHCTKGNFLSNKVLHVSKCRETYDRNCKNPTNIICDNYWILLTNIHLRGVQLLDTLLAHFELESKHIAVTVKNGAFIKKIESILGIEQAIEKDEDLSELEIEKVQNFVRRYAKYFTKYDPEFLSYFEEETGLTICHTIEDYTHRFTFDSKKIYPLADIDSKEKTYDIYLRERSENISENACTIESTSTYYYKTNGGNR